MKNPIFFQIPWQFSKIAVKHGHFVLDEFNRFFDGVGAVADGIFDIIA